MYIPELGRIIFSEELPGEVSDVGSRVKLHVETLSPVHDSLVNPSVGTIPEGGSRRPVHPLLHVKWKLEHPVRFLLTLLHQLLVNAVIHHLEEPKLLTSLRD